MGSGDNRNGSGPTGGGSDPDGPVTGMVRATQLEAAAIVACLVRRYGERHPDLPGVTTVTLTEEEMVGVGVDLTAMVDPMSGALYLRHRGEPLDP